MNKKAKKERARARCMEKFVEYNFTASEPCTLPKKPSDSAITRWFEVQIDKHWNAVSFSEEKEKGPFNGPMWLYGNQRFQDEHLIVIPDNWEVPSCIHVSTLEEVKATANTKVVYNAPENRWFVRDSVATIIYADEELNKLAHFDGRFQYWLKNVKRR